MWAPLSMEDISEGEMASPAKVTRTSECCVRWARTTAANRAMPP